MDPRERELAEAAASMTAKDLNYLQENGMLAGEEASRAGRPQGPRPAVSTPAPSVPAPRKPRRKRRRVKREWPDVGTILEAEYEGATYQAEVVEAPQYRSGRAIRILSGPAAGNVCSSMSGAMLKATEVQRHENGLGKRGMANGWGFWTVKGEPDGEKDSE